MPVTLTDREAKAAEKLLDRMVQDMDGDRVLAIALGEVKDDEFEAMRALRKALQGESTTRRSSSRNGDSGRVAIGRHAYDYLSEHGPSERSVRAVLKAAKPRKTLVGLAVPDAETAKLISTTLREGAGSAESRLERDRLASAASRVERLAA